MVPPGKGVVQSVGLVARLPPHTHTMDHIRLACGITETFIGAGGRAAITTGGVAITTLLPSTNCSIATSACMHAHGSGLSTHLGNINRTWCYKWSIHISIFHLFHFSETCHFSNSHPQTQLCPNYHHENTTNGHTHSHSHHDITFSQPANSHPANTNPFLASYYTHAYTPACPFTIPPLRVHPLDPSPNQPMIMHSRNLTLIQTICMHLRTKLNFPLHSYHIIPTTSFLHF